jgi:hypothetical protein
MAIGPGDSGEAVMSEQGFEDYGSEAAPEYAPFGDADTDAAQWDLSQAASAEQDASWYASEASDHLYDAGS